MPEPPAERLDEEPLFLACTRPAMVWGVPMDAMGFNLMVSSVAFLAARSMLWLLLPAGAAFRVPRHLPR